MGKSKKNARQRLGDAETGGRLNKLALDKHTTPRLKTQSPSLNRLNRYLARMEKASSTAEYLATFTRFLNEIEVTK